MTEWCGSGVWEQLLMYVSAAMFRACVLECTYHARVHEKGKVEVLQDGSGRDGQRQTGASVDWSEGIFTRASVRAEFGRERLER
jgi:hypothetical protein